MQQTQNRISQHDFSSPPARVRVIGYRYMVAFGPAVRPRVHLVDKQRSCSCPLKETCPAIDAVAEYLRNGGERAPDPLPACPICGAETLRDPLWDSHYTGEPGWRCTVGGLAHHLQARSEAIKATLRRKRTSTPENGGQAASEHASAAGR
jgi:hypothetical protein